LRLVLVLLGQVTSRLDKAFIRLEADTHMGTREAQLE
jgi:hypothetical protein